MPKKRILDKNDTIAAIKKHKGNFSRIAKELKITILRARTLKDNKEYKRYFSKYKPKVGQPKGLRTIKIESFPRDKLIEIIFKNMGICSRIADALKVSYNVIYNLKAKDPEITAAFKMAIEQNLDMAENSLLTNVKNRDNVATLFYLKCKGKDRDYIETVRNVNITGDEFERLKDDELNEKLNILSRCVETAENRTVETSD